jgi:hypothetical protein
MTYFNISKSYCLISHPSKAGSYKQPVIQQIAHAAFHPLGVRQYFPPPDLSVALGKDCWDACEKDLAEWQSLFPNDKVYWCKYRNTKPFMLYLKDLMYVVLTTLIDVANNPGGSDEDSEDDEYGYSGNRSFRQRVVSPTVSSPTYRVDSSSVWQHFITDII